MNETRTIQPTFDWARVFRVILAAGLLLVVALVSPRAARAANVIVVNSAADVVADDGQCTFREAVASANSNLASGVMAGECAAGVPGLDIIRFNIGGGGPQTIFTRPFYYLDVDEPVMIDGTSQPGYAGTPLIRLDGGDIAYVGLSLVPGSDGSTIKGLMLTRFRQATIDMWRTNGNVIQSNYIGTDGTSSLLSAYYAGISLRDSANNLIGGFGPGLWSEGNVISGNNSSASEGIYSGIYIFGSGSTGNKVQGNIIGADPTGTFAIPNWYGVAISDAPNNLIGESDTGSGNLISGNNYLGIVVWDSPGTQVRGNWIGTDITLVNPLAGNTGILVDGGTIQVYHNVIAFHDNGYGFSIELRGDARFLFGSTYNCMHDNKNGVYNGTGSTATFANNWWGDPSGPSGAGRGYGDPVSAYVTYRPWLTDPATACPSPW